MGARQAGELVRRYREQSGLTQETIAHELSQRLGTTIKQNQVSGHLAGRNWGNDPAPLARAYIDVLGIPEQEMVEAWGFVTTSKRAPRPTTLADMIKKDPSLTAAAKRHLLNQYGLLQMASAHERSGRPVLESPKNSGRSAAR